MTALPRDAALVELRPEALTFQTREGVLPGTTIDFRLTLEGRPLALAAPVEACLLVARDRAGYGFHVRLDLTALSGPDRQIIALFINKGRGSPGLLGPA